jgi:membrane associated rhomboid family serine protease
MPSLAAGLLASLAGWMISDLIQPYLGTVPAIIGSSVCSLIVFFAARRWLITLRGK